MSFEKIEVPINKGWADLKFFGDKILFRAVSIEVKKSRVTDNDGDKVAEAIAEGGVKFTTKRYNIYNFLKPQEKNRR